MKTASIERYHVYGTSRHHIRLLYRNAPAGWYENGTYVIADCVHHGMEELAVMKETARKQGFTHFKLTGSWPRYTSGSGSLANSHHWHLYWSPTAEYLGYVIAKDASAAKRKAPAQYRKYPGEIRAEESTREN